MSRVSIHDWPDNTADTDHIPRQGAETNSKLD